MDEKLWIRFWKMQNATINAKLFMHILHFCLRKEVKIYFMQASRQNLNFVYLQKTKTLILHLVAIKTIFTQQPNLEMSWMIYKHSLNIQCSTVADKMKLLCRHGNQIHLLTKKILFLGQEVFAYQIWAFYVLKWLR